MIAKPKINLNARIAKASRLAEYGSPINLPPIVNKKESRNDGVGLIDSTKRMSELTTPEAATSFPSGLNSFTMGVAVRSMEA